MILKHGTNRILIERYLNKIMTRAQLQIANSLLVSCFSHSSRVILASHWSKLKFMRQLIGYVKNRERRLELSVLRRSIKTQIHLDSIKSCTQKAVHIKPNDNNFILQFPLKFQVFFRV